MIKLYNFVYSNGFWPSTTAIYEEDPIPGTRLLTNPLWKIVFSDADIKPDQTYWIFELPLTEKGFFMELKAFVLMTAEKPEKVVACKITGVDTGGHGEWAAAGYDISPYSFACVGITNARNYFPPDCPAEQIRQVLWENLIYQ